MASYTGLDGYTVSDRYPYSRTDRRGVNYIQSVKVVVNCWRPVGFYIIDEQDPLVRSYAGTQIIPAHLASGGPVTTCAVSGNVVPDSGADLRQFPWMT